MATRRIEGGLWRWPGEGGWTFLTLPVELVDEVRAVREKRGFGSVPVRATLGATSWTTSVFPDSRSGSYLLPVKAAVRAREAVDEGDEVTITIDIELS